MQKRRYSITLLILEHLELNQQNMMAEIEELCSEKAF